MVGKSDKYSTGAANTKILKGEVQLTIGSTLPIQHAGHYLFNQLKQSEKGNTVDLLQDGGKIKKEKSIDHHRPRTFPKICHLPDPPTFSLVPTFKKSLRTHMYRMSKNQLFLFPRYKTHEEESNHIFFFLGQF
jgi:hypothetical protein